MNILNRFTGWLDVPLSENGIQEAQDLAGHCKRFDYDAAFTSNLERAHQTLLIILSSQHKIGVFSHGADERYNRLDRMPAWFKGETLPIFTSEALNERAYGELQGMNKEAAAKEFGEEQVLGWRRSFVARPPGGESLKDVYDRVVPYFETQIHPRIKAGETILMTAHGNTLRAVIKFLESISDEQIPFIELETARPVIYACEQDVFRRMEGDYRFDRPLR